jgi:predicted nucleic acid-binding protein
MESSFLGLTLDSSVLIAAERRKLTAAQAIQNIRQITGDLPIVLSALTIAEIGHSICRANTPEIRERRRTFLDDLKATTPHLSRDRRYCGDHSPSRRSAGRKGGQSSAGRSHHRSVRAGTRLRGRNQQSPRFCPSPRPQNPAALSDRQRAGLCERTWEECSIRDYMVRSPAVGHA